MFDLPGHVFVSAEVGEVGVDEHVGGIVRICAAHIQPVHVTTK